MSTPWKRRWPPHPFGPTPSSGKKIDQPRAGISSTSVYRTAGLICPRDARVKPASPRRSTNTRSASKMVIATNGVATAIWRSSFTSSAIFTSPCTRPQMQIGAAIASPSNRTHTLEISMRPGIRPWFTGLRTALIPGAPTTTAHTLEQIYAAQKDADSWKPGETDDIAWESNQLARSEIYKALNIPVEPCQPDVDSYAQAPEGHVDLDSSYMSKAATIAGQQLAKAGFRLASLLNGIWLSSSPTKNCAPAPSSGGR